MNHIGGCCGADEYHEDTGLFDGDDEQMAPRQGFLQVIHSPPREEIVDDGTIKIVCREGQLRYELQTDDPPPRPVKRAFEGNREEVYQQGPSRSGRIVRGFYGWCHYLRGYARNTAEPLDHEDAFEAILTDKQIDHRNLAMLHRSNYLPQLAWVNPNSRNICILFLKATAIDWMSEAAKVRARDLQQWLYDV